MANKPPISRYRRAFYVVSHASNERYRQRFDGTEMEHLSEEHLGNRVDTETVWSRKAGKGIEIIDTHDGIPGEIVPLGLDGKLWSFIKPNTNVRMSQRFPFAIVTVLHAEQVARSLKGRRWVKVQEDGPGHTGFALSPEQLQKLEGLKKDLPLKAPKEKVAVQAQINLEFHAPDGATTYILCASIKEAEEKINNPPNGLTYVRAWVPITTEEVKRKKLVL